MYCTYFLEIIANNKKYFVNIFFSGLLGGHVAAVALKRDGKGMAWYNGELLDMARDIATRLLPAFNTSTGIPYPKVSQQSKDSKPYNGHQMWMGLGLTACK